MSQIESHIRHYAEEKKKNCRLCNAGVPGDIPGKVECSNCNGAKGHTACNECKGKGWIKCDPCGGTGKIEDIDDDDEREVEEFIK